MSCSVNYRTEFRHFIRVDCFPERILHRVNDTDFWDVVPPEQYSIRVNDTDFWDVVPPEQYHFLKRVSLKLKYSSSVTDKRLNDCVPVAIARYTPNYGKPGEELQCQLSH